MNRVIDVPALHVYFWERATNQKVTVEARELAEALGISPATLYTAIREMVSEGRLVFAHKTSARHPVYEVVDPAQFGQTITARPAGPTPKTQEAPHVPRGRRPAWG